MAPLPDSLRSKFESTVTSAREIAERAARAALERLAVDRSEVFEHLRDEEKQLRVRLRAVGRQHGDVRRSNGAQSIDKLAAECAYEYWHRMLFARFLAENHLLMHPDGVAISLSECEELAADEGTDGWTLASRYAAIMLPQIFRPDDPVLQISFAPEHKHALEKLLGGLTPEVFLADDSLGWVYQFWQADEKKRVNSSGEKIDGDTLPAVTQLFTEPYMVKFLLHNTIGAWWCGQHGITGPPDGVGVPAGVAPVEMEYLRWCADGSPAAGTFEHWPSSLKDFTMLDPCCGSGHFLVESFNLLVPLRIHDEGLTPESACDAVLKDNLFGLELDQRCTQLAAFALAFAAWKYRDGTGRPIGYRKLPTLNVACSGQSLTGKKEDWFALADGNGRLSEGMASLHDLFAQAPILGSLIDPSRERGDMFSAGFDELRPLLERALNGEHLRANPDFQAAGVSAFGIALAASLLSKQYTLVATNVPYLAERKQTDILSSYVYSHHRRAKPDLAAAFVDHLQNKVLHGSSIALVTPQSWLFQPQYEEMRRWFLDQHEWNLVARLGTVCGNYLWRHGWEECRT